MENKDFTPPFLIQMTSGQSGQHCDKFPHGSLHWACHREKDDQWRRVKQNGAGLEREDIIPTKFSFHTMLQDNVGEVKLCPDCANTFKENWPFLGGTCIRCYERKNIPNLNGITRDDYREALREELLIEINNTL